MKLSDEQKRLLDQLPKLPESDLVTEILRLKVEGLTHQQIADELKISKSYVNQLSSRARKSYLQEMNQ